jgi:hypothetical protein
MNAASAVRIATVGIGGPAILCLSLHASDGLAQITQATHEHETMQLVLARICAHEASLPVHDEDDADGDGDHDEWVRRRDHSVEFGADCAAIHEVLLRGALQMQEVRRLRAEREGRVLGELPSSRAYVMFAHAYSTRIFEPVDGDANRWAADLRPDGSEPNGWRHERTVCTDGVCRSVRGPAWARLDRDAWLFVYGLATDLVAHGLDDVRAWSPCESEVDDWGCTMDHEHARSIGLVPVTCGAAGNTANTFYARPERIALRARAAERVLH